MVLSMSKFAGGMGYLPRASGPPFRNGLLPGFPGGTSYSVAVLRCCSRKGERGGSLEGRGWRLEAKG
jgi:hypothetical protein